MLKKRSIWIASLILLIIIVAGGFYYYKTKILTANAAVQDAPALQTAVARLGDLEILASGSGEVIPVSQIGLGFDESGTLIEMNVREGDKVQAGDILARLQTENTPEDIAAAISDAELEVISAQQALDELYASAGSSKATAMNNVATYEQAVRDAQYQLENYTVPTTLQNLDTVEAVNLMKQRLDVASKAFEPYKYLSSGDDTRKKFLEALNDAQADYDAAVKRLNYEYALQVAQANLENAQDEYEKYKIGPAADELQLAQAELENAKAKLALAQSDQAVIELVAPSNGIVMAVDAGVGEAPGTTAIITLANLDQHLLEVYLDETDLDKVALGNEAEVVFDALPDRTFIGHIVSISPGLETVENTPAIKTQVLLDQDSADVYLPVGLNASVDIIAGRAENAVLVPVEALRKLDEGEYAIFVMEDGELVMRMVQVGLMDTTTAQIISGLQAGETVSTGIVQTR